MIKVGIVDDHPAICDGLSTLLGHYKHIDVTLTAGNCEELFAKLTSSFPDILLLDLRMPEKDGAVIYQLLRDKFPDLRVIIFSDFLTPAHIRHYMSIGAASCIPKTVPVAKIVHGIEVVFYHGVFHSEDVHLALNDKSLEKVVDLTEQEFKVLVLFAANKTTEEVANMLGIAIRTVEGHRANLLRKTRCRNIASAVDYIRKYKYITKFYPT